MTTNFELGVRLGIAMATKWPDISERTRVGEVDYSTDWAAFAVPVDPATVVDGPYPEPTSLMQFEEVCPAAEYVCDRRHMRAGYGKVSNTAIVMLEPQSANAR